MSDDGNAEDQVSTDTRDEDATHQAQEIVTTVEQIQSYNERSGEIASTRQEMQKENELFSFPEKKRPRRSRDSERPVAVKYTSIVDLYEKDFSGNDAIGLQAYVMHIPEVPRWVEVTDKRTKEKQNVPVVSLTLTDRTGSILMDLWRDQAENALSRLTTPSETESLANIIERKFLQ